jgi:DNA repair exonuclease SbcCD ATPase subunit
MATNSEEKSVTNGEVREGQNVDKIRDILFGSQMRDYEKRFIRLEERLAKASDALRDDLKKRFDSLESFVQQEMDALGQRLKTEKTERADALKELTRETRDNAKSLEKKLSQLEEQLSTAQGDLRTRILDQSKLLGNEIRKAQTDMEAALEREVETLRNEKTDRETLGDMFSELGLRLKGELELPEK